MWLGKTNPGEGGLVNKPRIKRNRSNTNTDDNMSTYIRQAADRGFG